MKKAGVWQTEPPPWVGTFQPAVEFPDPSAFWAWVQFIYIPNHLSPNPFVQNRKSYLAPQVRRYQPAAFADSALLQLIVEIDADS